MSDAAIAGSTIETRDDLGDDAAATWAYWTGQEEVAEKEERDWIRRSREIVKRYRDERAESNTTHRFNILWSNVQTLKPTLYARTPKPDVARRFNDQAPAARYAAILMERCLDYSINACEFDAVMKAVVEDRLLPGRGVARVRYVPHFGEPIEDDAAQEGAAEKPPAGAKTSDAAGEDRAESATQGAAVDDVAGKGDEDGGDDEQASPGKPEPVRAVDYEEATADYVFWEDYREGPARQWKEVSWVRYRSYLTRDELIERFGKKKAKQITLDYTPKGSSETGKDAPPPDLYKKAIIHEYWDKTKQQAIWLAPATPDLILDTKDDPLRLPEFFPNPDPLLATTTNDKRIPVPDYSEYQDQARELDTLTARIDRLVRALKVSGVYPGEEKQVLQQLVDEGTDNRLIPVGDWGAWTDKGGLGGFIQWMPIQQVAETLVQLYNARDRVKAILYEITGLGDILRGMTQPEETLGAQELKVTFSTRRISPQQKDVARFARDMLRLLGGVIAGHFSERTVSLITGFPQLDPVPPIPPQPQRPQVLPAPLALPGMMTPEAPGPAAAANGAMPPGAPQPQPQDPRMVAYEQAMAQWQQAIGQIQAVTRSNEVKQQKFSEAVALMKKDGVHGFKIDIEADSTIAPDEQAEKRARTEFLSEFIPLMQQIIPMAQGNPPLAALAKEVALFGVRGFRVARSLEETIEKAFDAIAQMPPHPSQQGKGKPDSPDSPQALALRGHEIDSRSQVEQQKNAVKMTEIASRERTETMKNATQQEHDREKLAFEAEKAADQHALRAVRMTHIEARDARQLT